MDIEDVYKGFDLANRIERLTKEQRVARSSFAFGIALAWIMMLSLAVGGYTALKTQQADVDALRKRLLEVEIGPHMNRDGSYYHALDGAGMAVAAPPWEVIEDRLREALEDAQKRIHSLEEASKKSAPPPMSCGEFRYDTRNVTLLHSVPRNIGTLNTPAVSIEPLSTLTAGEGVTLIQDAAGNVTAVVDN